MEQGIGASGGIGIGTAVLLYGASLDYARVIYAGAEAEKERLAAAMAHFTAQTRQMAEHLKTQVGEKQSEILLGQIVMLGDPALRRQMQDAIDGGQCAEAALDAVCTQYIDLFSGLEDELTRQRATDVRDLRDRMLELLLGRTEVDLSALPQDAILVTHDLTPSMTAALPRGRVAGIITEVGGMTSHAAILARALALPAVLGVAAAVSRIADGDTVIVDGDAGAILVAPEASVCAAYRVRQDAIRHAHAALEQFRGKPTCTADGHTVRLCGNIGGLQDTQAVCDADGEGIGLFRTEFLFLDRACIPTEEEQYAIYTAVLKRMAGKEVIIRTLDVGGDKDAPALGLKAEQNPFLGYRAIRYCLGHEALFAGQLRALLRASAHGALKIMLPLVTCMEELRAVRALIARLQSTLDAAQIPYCPNVPLGVMIETPAAVLIADLLAQEADFFSIGTNDLTQYIMAADRGNADVSALNSPLHPAVLRAIRHTIACAHAAHIPVGMCGEAAANPLLLPLLLAFGLDEFSVGAATLLATRKNIAAWRMEDAHRLTAQVMACSDATAVRALLNAAAEKHALTAHK